MGPILGGIKLDAKIYGKFEGFPIFPQNIVHEVWVGVIVHDP